MNVVGKSPKIGKNAFKEFGSDRGYILAHLGAVSDPIHPNS
jgi:hypothetical protein